MPTQFALTTMYMLVSLNSVGQLAAVPKEELPSGFTGPLLSNLETCNFARGRMADPTKYTCQKFTSAKETSWTRESGAPEALPVEKAKEPPKDDRGDIDPKMLDGIGDPNRATPTPKRLSEQQSSRRVREAEGDAAKQPMFSGNPFKTVFNW
jgi:hypothetical protein